MWINKNHLKEATNKGNIERFGYFWHFSLAMKEAVFLFIISIGSLIHAIFPWFFDFKLLEWRINRLKKLKKELPSDPLLKKVEFHD